MTFFRWLFGLPLAALVTVGLFAMMAGLIKKEVVVDEEKPTPRLDFLMKPQPPEGEKPQPQKDKLPDEPPTKIDFPGPTDVPGPVTPRPDQTTVDTTPDGEGLNLGGAVITFPPPYPENCRSRGIEGSVVVQFDVTPEGNVVNVRVIEAPDRCFARIARTIAKWKYPPAYQNGRPVMRYGVEERFIFQLSE